ncbi:2-keto-4-pentenoate hydratase/2-oxohepta-3-ene-1,7-dioic acid hydratase (catechol pathway) [Agrococcus baldri]|uniref:2-keto-4-pentenoate hydratase/2-oxohepta-3-ene-1,7-dioic acid hydratase (Catechol pathway) n=1 Tax=Agrococcus baldri TaxID=153730 RepID=A0AA94KZ11_9MICO|nr:fumarylacetoacetate hydrolase family protein [Agrococcus baldri]SFS06926.1 2-keto-4-pentenoate hydratase/2-oxohepta-3-ene-1,7-dioic acid hydratase (catechol pathway) [Agrococcus baldri]
MELMRIGAIGRERPVVRHDGATYALDSLTGDIDGVFLASDGIGRVAQALAAGELPAVSIEGERVGAPIARPTAVICIGQNYAAHAAESGAEPPSELIVFFKHPNTVVGPFDDVVIPPGAEQLDWEVELGVVIGRAANRLSSRDEAEAAIAGYVVCNDVSERHHQLVTSLGQWSKGKTAPTFCPVGPLLVPAGEVESGDLRIWSTVNGEPRQDSTTADLIFDVPAIVHGLSQHVQLEPGDLICTGTPQGVALSGRFPYLADGDVMEMGLTGLGEQRSHLIAASARA